MQWITRVSPHFVIFTPPQAIPESQVRRIVDAAECAYERIGSWLPQFKGRKLYIYLTNSSAEELPEGWAENGRRLADRSALVWLDVKDGMSLTGFEGRLLWTAAHLSGVRRSREREIGALRRFLEATAPNSNDLNELQARAAARLQNRPSVRLFAAGPDAGLMDLAFLGYLYDSFATAVFDRFVRVLLAEGPVAAADVALGKPFEAVAHDWLQSLKQRNQGPARKALGKSLTLLKAYPGQVTVLLGLISIDVVFGTSIPISTKFLFDDIIASGQIRLIPLWIVAVLVAFLIAALAGFQRSALASLVQEMTRYDLLRSSFDHIQNLSLRYLSKPGAAGLPAGLTEDSARISFSTGRILPELTFEIVTLIVTSIVLIALNWAMGLSILLLGIPFIAAARIKAIHDLDAANLALKDDTAALSSFLEANLSAHAIVKSFSLEWSARLGFGSILDRLFGPGMRANRASGRLAGSSAGTLLALRIAALAFGALLISRDALSIGELFAFVALTNQALSPAASIADLFFRLRNTADAFDRMDELFGQQPEVTEVVDPRTLEPLRNEIRFQGVSFRYDMGRDILRDLSFTIEAGSRVAIVGPSGAGKSSLAGLLLRLYDPTQGCILLDGTDISLAEISTLRGQIGLVSRQTLLFDLSIADNIAIGREGAKERSLHAAARLAGLSASILALEHGYETTATELGADFTGLDRQRLGIARAMVRDPRILILDDATSSLDAGWEAELLPIFEKAGKGRTVIMITNSLKAAATLDTILVLDRGSLVEQGSHSELLEVGGLYSKLWQEATGADQVVAGADVAEAPRSIHRDRVSAAA